MALASAGEAPPSSRRSLSRRLDGRFTGSKPGRLLELVDKRVKRAVDVVRRALIANAIERRAHDPVAQRLHEARLADACIAGDEHELPDAARRLAP